MGTYSKNKVVMKFFGLLVPILTLCSEIPPLPYESECHKIMSNFADLTDKYKTCSLNTIDIEKRLTSCENHLVYNLRQELEKIRSHYDAEVGALKTELKELKQTVNGNMNSINDHYQKLTSRTMDVYFIFGLSDHMTYHNQEEIIKFNVDKGSGNHTYNPKTGIFTVKYEGTYFFYVTFLRTSHKQNSGVALYVDGKQLARAYSEEQKINY